MINTRTPSPYSDKSHKGVEMNGAQEWQMALQGWVTWQKAGRLSPNTLRLRKYQLLRVAAAFPAGPWKVTGRQLEEWLAARVWTPATARSHQTSLTRFYRWAIEHELTTVDPTRTLPKIHELEGVPRPATERAIDDALAQADDRQFLMIRLAARHGLRRGEIARVNTSDLIEGARSWSLLVHGKGGKDRVVPLFPETARAIREAEAGWLFPNGKGSHLSPGHVGVLITRALPVGVTPHQLRHRFATKAYRQTKDILNLRILMGHASVKTTQRYAEADEDEQLAVLMAAA